MNTKKEDAISKLQNAENPTEKKKIRFLNT